MNEFVLRLPDSLHAERSYAADVVLRLHLGLTFDAVFENRQDVVMQRVADMSRTLRMPDHVFSGGDKGWPTNAVRPSPIAFIPSACRQSEAPFGIAGSSEATAHHEKLDIDVLGTAFWYLARVEESLTDWRDSHGRFPLAASSNDSQCPTVDLLTRALGTALIKIWPNLTLRQHAYELRPTHDVDRPFKHLFQTPSALLKQMLGDARRGDGLSSVLSSPWQRKRIRAGELEADPFNTFDWLMDESERVGVRSTFYFISKSAKGGIDGDYRIDDPHIRSLLRRIHARGHLIGLHGSYMSALSADLLRSEAERLRRVCDEEDIDLGPMRLRQHVLRHEPRRSVAVWEEAGIAEDSTLGYAERAGFRCGTSRPFPLFDLESRRATSVLERPLVAMDVSLTEARYEALGFERAEERLSDLADTCRQYGGTFVLLWHNCRFVDSRARSTYARTLTRAAPGGAGDE